MRVSVYGLGKLGLPLALVLAEAGHHVIGVDRNKDQIDRIKRGELWHEPGLKNLWKNYYHLPSGGYFAISQGHLELTSNGEFAAETTDASFIVVPTPSDPATDMFINDYVIQAAETIGKSLVQKPTPHLVVVVSTVMPGASNEKIIPAIERTSGKKLNEGFYYGYSPEFIALGSVVKDLKNPEFALFGGSSVVAVDLWQTIVNYMPPTTLTYSMTPLEAEVAKISLNTYVTMKISFANQLDELCESLGVRSYVVAEAVGHDSRIGHRCLTPGPPFGGPCFPRDARAFSALAAKQGVLAELAEATTHVNNRQIRRIVNKVESGSKVGVVGLTYKIGTEVTEESCGLKLLKALHALHYETVAYDPVVQKDRLHDLTCCDTIVFTLPYEIDEIDLSGKNVIHVWK